HDVRPWTSDPNRPDSQNCRGRLYWKPAIFDSVVFLLRRPVGLDSQDLPRVYISSTLSAWQQKPPPSESVGRIPSVSNRWPRIVKPPSSTSYTQQSTLWNGRSSSGGSTRITSGCAPTPNSGRST